MRFMAAAIDRKCSKNLRARSSYGSSCAASSRAISSMFWQNSAIQAVPSACSRWPPVGSGARAVEDADVVEAQEAALEDVAPRRSLRLTHQVKLASSLWKARLRKAMSPCARAAPARAVDEERRPGVHGRVHVAEVPLVGRDLPAGVQVRLAQHQLQLLLGEVHVHPRQRHRVEGQVPGRVPGVLPLVRHGDDVVVDHVAPLAVAHRPARRGGGRRRARPASGRRRRSSTACSTASRRGPGASPRASSSRGRGRGDRAVELVRLAPARLERPVEAGEGIRSTGSQPCP